MSGRAVGPLVAALLITTVGIGWCFLVNAISFAAVLAALLAMQRSALHPVQRVTPAPGQLLEGFRYALTVPEILGPVAMMALIGTFTYEFEVSLPLFAKVSLAGGAASYSWLLGAFGAGSVVGGIYCMLRPELGLPRLVRAASLYGGGDACDSVRTHANDCGRSAVCRRTGEHYLHHDGQCDDSVGSRATISRAG